MEYIKWTEKEEMLMDQYKWPLFFKIPKLLNLCDEIKRKSTNKWKLILEFYFLFKRNENTWKDVEKATEVMLRNSIN